MKKIMNCFVLLFALLCFFSCTNEAQIKVLEVPTNVRVENDTIKWSNVDYTESYRVRINEDEYSTTINFFSIVDFEPGTYLISVKALGDGKSFDSSAYSSSISYTKKSGAGSVEATFGSFEEITTKEAYIGYGIDIIKATGINSKNVKTTFPIFNLEKLREERLLKSNEHYNSFITGEGESIEELLENMGKTSSSSAGMNVSVKGKFYSTSAGVSVALSAGAESSLKKSEQGSYKQRFLQILSENQSYWLMLQSTEARFKELLSDEFKKDLYDTTLSPANLFEKYGTHLLTSVAMGGSISLNYTLSSTDSTSTSNQLSSISSKIQANVSYAYGKKFGFDVGTEINSNDVFSYRAEASAQNVNVKQTVFCSGGATYGINSEDTLLQYYYEWQKSLDSNPVVIGIKDSNSLYPIWHLLDLNVPGAADRYKELEDYFIEYGTESLKRVCEEYDIKPPEPPKEIVNISVNGYPLEDISKSIKVMAGTNVSLGFDVLPENATDYTKVFLLNDKGAEYETIENGVPTTKSYVSISDNGIMTIDSNAPAGIIFTVKLVAGKASQTISFTVESSYTVSFNTRIQGLDVEPYTYIRYGSCINAPKIQREGYALEGWYKDIENTNLFDFDIDYVTSNMTLYAKWVPLKYTLTLNTCDDKDSTKQIVRYGNKPEEPIEDPIRNGYRFAGWYADEEYTELFDFSEPLYSNTTAYARWTAITYTVSFVTGEVAIPLSPVKVGIDTEYKVSQPKIEDAYYEIEGWYEDSTFTKKFFFGTTIKKDITLYANWVPKEVLVEFKDNKGNSLKDSYGNLIQGKTTNIQKGFRIDSVPNPVVDDLDFKCWVLNGESIDLSTYDGFKPNSNGSSYIVRAIFYDTEYNLTFNVDGNSVSTKQMAGNLIVVPKELSKEGYDIKFENLPSVMPNEDISVIGNYVAKEYTIQVMCKDEDGKGLEMASLGPYSFEKEYEVELPNIKGYVPINKVVVKMEGSYQPYTYLTVVYKPACIKTSYNLGVLEYDFSELNSTNHLFSDMDEYDYNEQTGTLTIYPDYKGDKVDVVVLKGSFNTLNSKGQIVQDIIDNLSICFDDSWEKDVKIVLKNMSFSSDSSIPQIDLNGCDGNTVEIEVKGKNLITTNDGNPLIPLIDADNVSLSIKGNDLSSELIVNSNVSYEVLQNEKTAIRCNSLVVEGLKQFVVIAGNGAAERNGGTAIVCDSFVASDVRGIIRGGNGGDGIKSTSKYSSGTNGANGGSSIIADVVNLNNTSIQFIAGNGGKGGEGYDGKTGFAAWKDGGNPIEAEHGTIGGNGGNGAKAIDSNSIYGLSLYDVVKNGNGGKGGKGGNGGNGGTKNGDGVLIINTSLWGGINGGNAGNGGKGGDGYGAAGEGGDAGTRGVRGYIYNHSWDHGTFYGSDGSKASKGTPGNLL